MKTIGIFKTNCPTGWTRLSSWDGKFLQGASTYGATGGTETHLHAINLPNQHMSFTHASLVNLGNQNYGPEYIAHFYHGHDVNPASANTDTVNHLPEYIDVVYCYLED